MKNWNNQKKDNNLIEIGKVVKAQGIKGDVKVFPMTDDDFDFLGLESVVLDGITYNVQKVYALKGCWGIKLSGIDTCNDAEALKNKQMYITKDQFVLPEGRWLIEDLIGRPVALTTGKVIGTIADINNFGSADVIAINNDGRECLCSHKEGLIKHIDELGRVIFDAKIFSEVAIYND